MNGLERLRCRDQTRFEAPLFPEEQQRQEDLPRRAAAAAAAVSFPIDVAEKVGHLLTPSVVVLLMPSDSRITASKWPRNVSTVRS